MAGKGFLDKGRTDSIMQFKMLRARKDTRDARQSEIAGKILEERSRDCSVFACGETLEAFIHIKPLSGRR